MRLGHLLLLVLVGLLLGFTLAGSATAQSQPKPANQTLSFNGGKTPDFSLPGKDLFDKATEDLNSGGLQLRLQTDSSWDVSQLIRPQARPDRVCYAMRTYRVARVDRSSDVVEPAGYTTCQPSSNYSVKHAVEQAPSASR